MINQIDRFDLWEKQIMFICAIERFGLNIFFFYSMESEKGIFEGGILVVERRKKKRKNKNSFDVICASGRGTDVSSRK